MIYTAIGLGGAIGSMLRAWLGGRVQHWAGPGFPWGTILVNASGCFVIGVFGALAREDGPLAAMPGLQAFLIVGLCGGYTTFSAFSLQNFQLLQAGRPVSALANVAVSLLSCLAAVALGYAAGARA